MPSFSFAPLADRSLIRVSGDEAHHFLQNLVTADVEDIDKSGAGSAALLTPQGKILFDFLIYKQSDAYILDSPAQAAADLLKRLTFYRLRSKVDLELMPDDVGVVALWNGTADVDNAIVAVTDPRLPALGQRFVGPISALLTELGVSAADLADYDQHRIELGVPEGLKDYDYSDIFPHDAVLDQLGGVSFSKGCYVGQEVVSRVHHRGTARKRFVKVESSGQLPPKGTTVTADGKSVGILGSSTLVNGKAFGLALLRLDKVRQAKDNGIPLQCGDAELQATLPDWVEFTWPEPNTAD
ncbi:MAG: folate-binding protein YgfZ [Roseibium sp.]|uniref:CAF17-like 4Fe-4S cluster assembly/insertion protein YgfZ n=1 Tax=Roseibium sp. TaxID=1936156 RepID=UPI00262D175F|nr:folate-binding protein YgfZ [Roseibium sp.]MCV0424262.1 folate-binding protein YgfZ [Roseibium sp.]